MADPVVHLTAGVPDSGTGNVTTLGQVIDPTNGPAAIKAASTSPVATDKALVVGLSPNSAGIITTGTAGSPASQVLSVQGITSGTTLQVTPTDQYSNYFTAAASATTLMGATGAVGDYLAGVVIIPGVAAAGTVGITDGNGSTISLFAGGGTTALPTLAPFFVPLGAAAKIATTAGWRIINGANVTAIGVGKFT